MLDLQTIGTLLMTALMPSLNTKYCSRALKRATTQHLSV
jgi:hypothetical protein